jgi:hypothetical protein
MPADLPINPARFSGEPAALQAMVDCYSWRSFLATSWPAREGQRGVADKKSGLSDTAKPRVWETYKETFEVFQPSRPDWSIADQHWDDPVPLPEACRKLVADLDTGAPAKVLRMITKTRSHQILNETHQAMGNQFNILIDQDGKLIRYEVRFNRDEFEYLKENGFADTGSYSFAGPKQGDVFFPTQVTGFTGKGSIEVKAAWRELCAPDAEGRCSEEEEALAKKYYHQTVLIYTPESTAGPATCRVSRAGLVGFHLIRKTYRAPQWVWATFEHLENVPPVEADPKAGTGKYLLQGGCEDKTPPAAYCSLMRPGAIPGSKLAALRVPPPAGTDANCCPNSQLIINAHPGKAGTEGRLKPSSPGEPLTKNQVSRLIPVRPTAMNARFQAALPPPWSNYFLVNAQWPKGARQVEGEHAGAVRTIPCNVRDHLWSQTGETQSAFVQAGIPKPECFAMAPVDASGIPVNLRNTTMETFQATWNHAGEADANQVSSQSCLNCHGFSGVDGSFVFTDAEEISAPVAGAARVLPAASGDRP